MPAVATSSGYTFHLRDVYTHGMEVAFNEALTRGVELRHEDGEVVVNKIDAGAFDRAVAAVLELLVEKVMKEGQQVQYSTDLLMTLPQSDYLVLKEKVESVREASEKKKVVGKKNS